MCIGLYYLIILFKFICNLAIIIGSTKGKKQSAIDFFFFLLKKKIQEVLSDTYNCILS